MLKRVLMVAMVAVAACDSPMTPAEFEPSFAVGGGNPHFSPDFTWCSTNTTQATCAFKLVGLGKNADALVALDVSARQVFSCANPNGFITPGHTDKVRLGGASGSYRSDKNGSIQSVIQAAIEWSTLHGNAPACPESHTLVPGSVSDEVSWQLSGTGQNKGGVFTVYFRSL